jgi:hypothetical protein
MYRKSTSVWGLKLLVSYLKLWYLGVMAAMHKLTKPLELNLSQTLKKPRVR